jgi:hypothetical protein
MVTCCCFGVNSRSFTPDISNIRREAIIDVVPLYLSLRYTTSVMPVVRGVVGDDGMITSSYLAERLLTSELDMMTSIKQQLPTTLNTHTVTALYNHLCALVVRGKCHISVIVTHTLPRNF